MAKKTSGKPTVEAAAAKPKKPSSLLKKAKPQEQKESQKEKKIRSARALRRRPLMEYLKLGDLPQSLMDTWMMEFTPYSVALARVRDKDPKSFRPIGSGVLIRKGKRVGILTAHHCLHACEPEVDLGPEGRDRLFLMVGRNRAVQLLPGEVFEHPLAKPKCDEFGPDLTFVEILPGERQNTVKAYGSFWPLDRNSNAIIRTFSRRATPICTIGFPKVDYKTLVKTSEIHHGVRHVTFMGVIEVDSLIKRDGWDYIESKCFYERNSDLPDTFQGVSGGPMWGLQIHRDKTTKEYRIGKTALLGIVFHESEQIGNERRLRGHFVRSIYHTAWKHLPKGFA